MRKDPTKFRQRYKMWKEGAKPYQYGIPYDWETADKDRLPKYEDGKDAQITRVYKPYYDKDGVLVRNVDAELPETVVRPDSVLDPGERAILNRDRRRANAGYDEQKANEWTAKQLRIAKNPTTLELVFGYLADIASGVGIGADVVSRLPIYSSLKGSRELSKAFQTGDPMDYVQGAMWSLPAASKAIDPAINTFRQMSPKKYLRHVPIFNEIRSLYNPTRYTNEELDFIASKASEKIVPPNPEYISLFERNVEMMRPPENIFQVYPNSKDAVQILRENPEYLEHLKLIYGNILFSPELILSKRNIQDFIRRQGTSLRGVTAKNEKDAIKFMTEAEATTRTGGDMLDTNGGVYTSNSPTIVDRFKNPVGDGVEDGYVATLYHDYGINPNLTPIELLRQLRDAIAVIGQENPLYQIAPGKTTGRIQLLKYGNSEPYRAYKESSRKTAQSFTSPYGSGTQLAHLPNSDGSKKTVASIDKMKKYPAQTDKRGRWQFGETQQTETPRELFIGKKLSPYDIEQYRKFVESPTITHDRNIRATVNKQLTDRQAKQIRLYNKMLDNNIKVKNNLLDVLRITIPTGAGLGAIYGAKAYARENDKFYDSPEYRQLLEDPDYKKAIESDDGSLEKLEKKYKDKYKIRLRDEKINAQNKQK